MNFKEIREPVVQGRGRFDGGIYDSSLYEAALRCALLKTDANLGKYIDRYPHVSVNNVYLPEENKLWTASFFPGITYLAYEVTCCVHYLQYADNYLQSFEKRLLEGHTSTHDLGFLYTLSCVANYKITESQHAKAIAISAASKLAERYNEKGGYIQAWGEIGLLYPKVKIIIDTMLNLPLLYWAAKASGTEWFYEIAFNHAITASQYLVRADASTYHTYLMNPVTGEAVLGKTHQGRFDESTWARGQAWAVYGFALSYAYTKEPYFLEVATKTANYFINQLPDDFVPYWDFSFNDAEPDIRDSSAAAIFCCGLLELVKYLEGPKKDFYQKVVYRIVESLYLNYSTKDDPAADGLLLHGMYHRNNGADECTIWGDYYYFEALVRLLQDWQPYW